MQITGRRKRNTGSTSETSMRARTGVSTRTNTEAATRTGVSTRANTSINESCTISGFKIKEFRKSIINDRTDDGCYEGTITNAYFWVYNGVDKVVVKVKFKDNSGLCIQLSYITNFEGGNRRLIRLFDSFDVEYLIGDSISLENLINRDVVVEVKNNDKYCNVQNLTPSELYTHCTLEDIDKSIEFSDDECDELENPYDDAYDEFGDYYVDDEELDLPSEVI